MRHFLSSSLSVKLQVDTVNSSNCLKWKMVFLLVVEAPMQGTTSPTSCPRGSETIGTPPFCYCGLIQEYKLYFHSIFWRKFQPTPKPRCPLQEHQNSTRRICSSDLWRGITFVWTYSKNEQNPSFQQTKKNPIWKKVWETAQLAAVLEIPMSWKRENLERRRLHVSEFLTDLECSSVLPLLYLLPLSHMP